MNYLFDSPASTKENWSKLILNPWRVSYLSQTNATCLTVVLKCMFGWAEVLLCKKERVRVKLLRYLHKLLTHLHYIFF